MKWLMKTGRLIKWNLIKEKERGGFSFKGDETGGLGKCWGRLEKVLRFTSSPVSRKAYAKF